MAVFPHLIRSVVETVFPSDCLSCGKRGEYCCRDCLSRPVPHTKTVEAGGISVHAGYAYADPLVRSFIHDFKYLGSDAARACVEVLLHRWMLAAAHLIPEESVLIPVPMHPAKLAARGFNQAESLAHMLGAALDLPVVPDALFRVRGGVSQTRTEDRGGNVRGAFRARPGLQDEAVLVDDVVTSGATMRACAEALWASGARCRRSMALARGSVEKKK